MQAIPDNEKDLYFWLGKRALAGVIYTSLES